MNGAIKIINIPHDTSDFTCPVNGLCDIFEWKNGIRIDEYLLLGLQMGFTLVSNKNKNPKKMIFLENGIGKRLFEFWQPLMKYDIYFKENRTFKHTIASAQSLLDKDIPVILFGLDMYHLSFHEVYYHKIHIEGHAIMLVGYDSKHLYVHDNSKKGVMKITYADLERAWENDYEGVCKKFTYFGIDIKEKTNRNEIVKVAFTKIADAFLNPPVSFLGIKGYDKLLAELTTWNYSNIEMQEIYKNFIFFTGSTIPEYPYELDPNTPNISKFHRGGRDKMSWTINRIGQNYEIHDYREICEILNESGIIIEKINQTMINDILNNDYQDMAKYVTLFKKLKDNEIKLAQKLKY